MESSSKKRAAVACNYCRKRKRKCDGRQPVCTLCEESNGSQCVYQEPPFNGQHEEMGEVFDRLARLEQLVVDLAGNQTAESIPRPTYDSSAPIPFQDSSPANISTVHVSVDTPGALGVTPLAPTPAASAFGLTPGSEHTRSTSTAMTIPIAHSTTTGDLLRSEAFRSLLGEYPPYILTRVESKRAVPPCLSFTSQRNQTSLPDLSDWQTRHLVKAFFDFVGSQHPVLCRPTFESIYEDVIQNETGLTSSTCLVLVVLALGALSQGFELTQSSVETPPGVEFFEPALEYIMSQWLVSFSLDTHLAQAMYLASLYFGYLSRPLQTWRLAHMASTNAQYVLLWGKPSQDMIRLCWALFVLECDILAEHHLPRSGIEQVVENMPFPDCGSPPQSNMLSWLANISSRRLLNRIHHVLYDQSQRDSAASLSFGTREPSSRICQELHSQLHAWYDLLPEPIKPCLDQQTALEEATLAMRFHAAGDIIFRPSLLRALSLSAVNQQIPSYILENAIECLQHCQKYIEAVEFRLEKPSASLEIFLHSELTQNRALASILLLTQASLCPELANNVNNIYDLHSVVISLFEKWAAPDSSIEAMLSIIRAMVAKYRILV
ncbi:unnamed protein product, partial [Clonostachys rosea]